jgi:hypothetical protein
VKTLQVYAQCLNGFYSIGELMKTQYHHPTHQKRLNNKNVRMDMILVEKTADGVLWLINNL